MKNRLLLSLLSILLYAPLYSIDIQSSAISYRCLGSDNYQITLTLIVPCDTALIAPTSDTIALESAHCLPQNIILNFSTTTYPSQQCNTHCNRPGSYMIWVYTGNYVISNTCGDWTLSHEACCRPDFDNLQGTGLHAYTEIMHDSSASCSTASTIDYGRTTTEIANFRYCRNDLVTMQTKDVNAVGDSIHNILVSAQLAGGAIQPFSGSYSLVQPLSSLGAIAYFGDQLNFSVDSFQNAQLTFRRDYYRNGQLISSGYYEEIVFVDSCLDQIRRTSFQVLSGQQFDSTRQIVRICNIPDTIDMRIRYEGLLGSTLTIEPIQTNLGVIFGVNNVTVFPFHPVGSTNIVELFVQIRLNSAFLGFNTLCSSTNGQCCESGISTTAVIAMTNDSLIPSNSCHLEKLFPFFFIPCSYGIDTQQTMLQTDSLAHFCLDLPYYMNEISSIQDLCATASGSWTPNLPCSKVACIDYSAPSTPSNDTLCLEVCDVYGICDTNIIIINVVNILANQTIDSKEQEIQIYPNPAQNQVRINLSGNITTDNYLQINNVLGQKIYQTTFDHSNQLVVDISKWPTGMYICSLVSNGQIIQSKKLLVVKN